MDGETRTPTIRPVFVWTLWLLLVGAWSAALLRPEPAHAAAAVLPADEPRFYVLKTVHVLAYFVLTVLTGFQPIARPWRWLLLLFLSAHALGTEYLQQFVPSREGSWRDVGLDHIGIGLGLGIVLLLKWRFAPSSSANAGAPAGTNGLESGDETTTPMAGRPA